MHKKPRGTPFHFKISYNPDEPAREMEKVELQLPEDKVEIETTIAVKFACDLLNIKDEFIISEIQVNQQNDIDFRIKTRDGDMGLELVEYAPLGKGGYSKEVSPIFNPVDTGTAVNKLIVKKNGIYSQYNKLKNLVLLIYVTDVRFALSIYEIQVLQYLVFTSNNVFQSIYYYKPMEGADGIIQKIFPISKQEYEILAKTEIPLQCHRLL